MIIKKLFLAMSILLLSNIGLADEIEATNVCTVVDGGISTNYVFKKSADINIVEADNKNTVVTLSSYPDGHSTLFIKAAQMSSHLNMEVNKEYFFRTGQGTDFKDVVVSCGPLAVGHVAEGLVILK